MGGIADEQFRKILDNNIVSNHWLINMVAPEMTSAKDGSIIIISSIGGLKGSTVIGAYNISKAADMQLARNLALEFGADNVRVNCIAPGLIKTDFARALWDNPETLKACEPSARRCGASASPTRSRAPRCSWPRRPAASRPGRRSSSTAARRSAEAVSRRSGDYDVIPGRCESIELWCAIARLKISRRNLRPNLVPQSLNSGFAQTRAPE